MEPGLQTLIAALVLVVLALAAVQRQLFNPLWPNRRTLIVGIVLALLLLAALPIWHRHPDFGGIMHGHPLWGGGHVH